MAAAATGLTAVDGRVDEDTVLCDVLQRHLDFKTGAGSQAVRLQQYRQAGCQGLTVLMKKERCPVSWPSLHLASSDSRIDHCNGAQRVCVLPCIALFRPVIRHHDFQMLCDHWRPGGWGKNIVIL